MLVTDRRRFPAPRDGEAMAASEMQAVETALGSGVGIVQLREKDLDGGALLARADALRALCDRRGARLVVNDRVDVARIAGADGVHLPASGLSVAEARALLPSGALVGRSAHSSAELGVAEDADYVVFGPVFDTPSKRAFGAPQGLEGLRRAVAETAAPLVAIGGLDAEHAEAIAAAGAAGIAAISALLDHPEAAGRMAASMKAASGCSDGQVSR